MFEFLKNKKEQKPVESANDFMNIENSALNMQSESKSFSDDPNYQSLVYQEPVYDVPKYKAGNLNNLGIVVDSEAIGFDRNTINPNIKMIEIPNNDEEASNIDIIEQSTVPTEAEPIELIDIMEPITDSLVSSKEGVNNSGSIFQDIPSQTNNKHSDTIKKDDDTDKISLFGSSDGLKSINEYSSNNQYEEEKKELLKEVEYTKDGYKICPNCGAILNPNAPVCFMCSKSFVLKK